MIRVMQLSDGVAFATEDRRDIRWSSTGALWAHVGWYVHNLARVEQQYHKRVGYDGGRVAWHAWEMENGTYTLHQPGIAAPVLTFMVWEQRIEYVEVGE